jgi:hypothetical protein
MITIVSKTINKIVHLNPLEANAPARYWLAGCLTMQSGVFDWIPVNQFMDKKPHVEEPLHCYNRAALKAKKPVVLDANLVVVTPEFLLPNTGVARVSLNEESYTSTMMGGYGKAEFNITQSGYYTVDVSSNGYIPTKRNAIVQDSTNVAAVTNMIRQDTKNSIRLLLEWPGTYERYPTRDLDLNVLKVSRSSSQLTCKTYFNDMNLCPDVSLNQNSLMGGFKTGGEMITVSNAQANSVNTFMVFAQDNTLTGAAIEASGARLTVTDGEKIMVESIPQATLVGAKTWLIGCMETVGTSFNFVPLGTYSRQDPSTTGDKLKCHDLFKTYQAPEAEQFCKDATLNIEVYDSITDRAIYNPTVTIRADGSSFSKFVPSIVGANPINMNGEYVISVEAAGYISKMESITVNCDLTDCGSCNPTAMVSLSPTLGPEEFRLTLSWDQGETDLDMFVVQHNLNAKSYSCKTYFDDNASCAGVTMNKFNTAGSYNSETITFSDISVNTNMIHMVYIKYNPCLSANTPHEFFYTNPLLSISGGRITTQLQMNKASFNNEDYWLAGCIQASPNGFKNYKFVAVNAFLAEKPDKEVPYQCFQELGYENPAPAEKPWSILRPDTWFGK